MPDVESERRIRRSQDPLIALHYQLAQAREASSCDVVVLAEPSGLVVAGAGSWAACEELAAYAPFLAEAPTDGAVSRRVEALRPEVFVLSLVVDGQEMYLCARGGGSRQDGVAQAVEGISRILRAA